MVDASPTRAGDFCCRLRQFLKETQNKLPVDVSMVRLIAIFQQTVITSRRTDFSSDVFARFRIGRTAFFQALAAVPPSFATGALTNVVQVTLK